MQLGYYVRHVIGVLCSFNSKTPLYCNSTKCLLGTYSIVEAVGFLVL